MDTTLYPHKTWEPEENLIDCKKVLEAFETPELRRRLNVWPKEDLLRYLQPAGIGPVFVARVISLRPFSSNQREELAKQLMAGEGIGKERAANILLAVEKQMQRREENKEKARKRKIQRKEENRKKLRERTSSSNSENPFFFLDRNGDKKSNNNAN